MRKKSGTIIHISVLPPKQPSATAVVLNNLTTKTISISNITEES